MTKPKRNVNVKGCPNAERWVRKHPDAARNLRRIIRLMDGRYEGDYQGYINRDTNFVEYRFDPIEGERDFKHVQLFARQKHVVIRFSGFVKRKTKSLGISKTLKDAYGNDYPVLEFSVAANMSLDELEAFLRTTTTFARDWTAPQSRGSATHGSHKALTNLGKRTPRESIDRAELEAGEELTIPIESEEDARERELRTVFLRRGQPKFRAALLNAYERRCAVTGCTAENVLEAAHIIPYRGDNTNRCDNGLLLRADIHTLFDLGLLWINREMKVEIANDLQHTDYRKFKGKVIFLPTDTASRPHPKHLEHHAQIASELREARQRRSDRSCSRVIKGGADVRTHW
ncbi:HNH endonuclease [Paenalcaligenes sp. Me52]|uniref:HNH endonuclease n=1 Tax=Paenalcaligenes sp. Me52 TaxID=3392038 RepID=UPI003D29F3F7